MNDKQLPSSKPQTHRQQKKIVNFKHLIKVKFMNKHRKINTSRSIKQIFHTKTQQTQTYADSLIKLPLKAQLFQQITSPNHSRYISNKNANYLKFPSLRFKKEKNVAHSHNDFVSYQNKSYESSSFHSIKEKSLQKLKDIAKNRRQRSIISRLSQQSLPSKLECRSISPLSNEANPQHFIAPLELLPYTKYNYPSFHSSSQQKISSRYQDIPISQFLYDNTPSSSHHLSSSNMISKIQKIWRKRSKNTKQISFRN